jgi:hypothetical protein
MITSTLKLRFASRAVHEPRGWYIPGADPAAWLREISAWDVSQDSLRLYLVPRSRANRRPAGVLATAAGQFKPAVSRRCVAFGCPIEQLFVPAEAEFAPAVDSQELREHLSADHTYVWHPASGLMVIEAAEVLTIADLLTVPFPTATAWDRAVPGVGFSRRIVSIVPEQTPTIEDLIEDGQDDIGTETSEMDQLPPSPVEPKDDLLSNAGRQGKRALANMAGWLSRQLSKNSSGREAPTGRGAAAGRGGTAAANAGPGWADQLGQWANQQLEKIRAGMEAARHKEVARLLHMLDADPDQGLRYALPMGGDAHRGQALPGNRLTRRDVNFSLRGLGGGAPADFWNISYDYQCRLIARYRELANREIHLGRHRRAAYIFAELLGDYDAAANALASGHHWREAAVLYRDRLHRPLDAARCLEQGGLWTEAIALYRQVEEHEKAGDLLLRLDQEHEAHAEFRKAVARLRGQGDYVAAAQLLEKKLRSPDEAIAILDLGWPGSSQAGQCLRETFSLLGRLGRHESAAARVDDLGQQPLLTEREITVAEVLSELAHRYPDREVNRRAADNTRGIAARHLPMVSGSTSRQLLSAVAKLCPEDRLLRRDCDRYSQGITSVARPIVVPTAELIKTPRLVRTLHLPERIAWRTAIASGKTIYAAGMGKTFLCVARASWEEVDPQHRSWRLKRPMLHSQIILAAEPYGPKHVLVHALGRPPFTSPRHFRSSDSCPDSVSIGSVNGITENLLAADCVHGGMNWLLEAHAPGLTVKCTGPNGEQVSSQFLSVDASSMSLDSETDLELHHPFSIHARNNKVYVGAGRQMHICDGKSDLAEVVEFEQLIRGITGSAPNTRTRVVVTFPRGGAVYWDDFERGETEVFAADMLEPMATFNRGGYLVAACQDKCEVYATQGRQVRLKAEMGLSAGTPVAVLGGPRTDYFAVTYASGLIEIYEIP